MKLTADTDTSAWPASSTAVPAVPGIPAVSRSPTWPSKPPSLVSCALSTSSFLLSWLVSGRYHTRPHQQQEWLANHRAYPPPKLNNPRFTIPLPYPPSQAPRRLLPRVTRQPLLKVISRHIVRTRNRLTVRRSRTMQDRLRRRHKASLMDLHLNIPRSQLLYLRPNL